MNSGACANVEEAHNIIGSNFHLVAEGISIPLQLRGSIALVQLERTGRLNLIFSPPKTVIRFEKDIRVVHGVRKEMAEPEPLWKLLVSRPPYTSENEAVIPEAECLEIPFLDFRIT
mgnify:CR=1 FL=1